MNIVWAYFHTIHHIVTIISHVTSERNQKEDNSIVDNIALSLFMSTSCRTPIKLC